VKNQIIKLVIPKQKWSSPINPDKRQKYEEPYLVRTWLAFDGLKTDWQIEKRLDTDKPFILAKTCTGQRYGSFDRLSSAKLAAYLLDLG